MPRIIDLAPVTLRRATGLSPRYVNLICRGKIPHPIHFQALAELVNEPVPEQLQAAKPVSNPSGVKILEEV